MSSELVRWGGWAAIAAGVLHVLGGAVNLFAPQQRTDAAVFTSFSDYLIEVMFVLALLSTLGAIVGLHVLQRRRYGRLGVAGSAVAFVGHALLLVAATATALAGRGALDAAFPLGVLVALVGLVLLGAATLRAQLLPRWCGTLLIAGFPLAVILDVLANAGGALLGVVWTLVGYALLSNVEASARQPRRVR